MRSAVYLLPLPTLRRSVQCCHRLLPLPLMVMSAGRVVCRLIEGRAGYPRSDECICPVRLLRVCPHAHRSYSESQQNGLAGARGVVSGVQRANLWRRTCGPCSR
jgi:hypothetical protein